MKPAWTQGDLCRIADRMKRTAELGLYTGYESEIKGAYFQSCARRVFGTNLIYTRDSGHHTSGWFKNPDYQNCRHLSLSPVQSERLWTPAMPELDQKLRDGWLNAFFGEDLRYVWAESPKSEKGRQLGVWHWRLFCREHPDGSWEPILPRGEVYGTELTEVGWKSASELGVTIESVLVPG